MSGNDPTRDRSETSVFVAGGVGTYAVVHRGCEGTTNKFEVDYGDLGASVEHGFEGPARIGLRVGAIWPEDGPLDLSNIYVNPHVAVDWKAASLGLGGVVSQRSFPSVDGESIEPVISAHIRLGRLDKIYASSSWFENVPVYSGGGYFDIGLGGRPTRSFDLWLGVSAGPYDNGGVLVKASHRVGPSFSLALHARLGSSEGIDENAVSLGVGYRAVSANGDEDAAR